MFFQRGVPYSSYITSLGAAMSRLTPTKEMTDFQLQAALDIVANFTMNLKQAEKLVRAITITEGDDIWSPDIDDMADMFYTADLNNRRDATLQPIL
jgi:hypothetical protein